MFTLDFTDKSVTYDTFIHDVATSVVRMLADTRNVDRWRKQGKINPCKRPGKVEYRTVELRVLQQKQQDYFK